MGATHILLASSASGKACVFIVIRYHVTCVIESLLLSVFTTRRLSYGIHWTVWDLRHWEGSLPKASE